MINNQGRRLVVAIDGPASVGKGTIGFLVAEQLHYVFIDTGAMYRSVAWLVLQSSIPLSNDETISSLAENTRIVFSKSSEKARIGYDVFINNFEVTSEIRTPEIDFASSQISRNPKVRQSLIKQQRQMASEGGIVMEGRDICTVVLPNADIKLFITASAEERAKRRHKQRIERGLSSDLEQTLKEMIARDQQDTHRELGALRASPDAIVVDTSSMSISEAVIHVMKIIMDADERIQARM